MKPISLWVAATLILMALPIRATQSPAPQHPDIETLRAAKSGGGVQLTWSDGVSPFSVARDDRADFSNAPSLVLNGNIGPGNGGASGEYSKWLWATTADGLQLWRALRIVKLKIFIEQHAGDPFTNIPAASDAEITDWVRRSIKYANGIYATVGVQFQWDGVFNRVSVRATGGPADHSVAYLGASPSTSCGADLTNWAPMMDPYSVNVFIVHGIKVTESTSPADPKVLGRADANSFRNCNGGLFANALLSYGSPGYTAPTQSRSRVTTHTMAHELGHLLLDYNLTGVPYDGTGHSASTSHLMYFQDLSSAAKWTSQDGTIINSNANGLLSLLLPEGGAP